MLGRTDRSREQNLRLLAKSGCVEGLCGPLGSSMLRSSKRIDGAHQKDT